MKKRIWIFLFVGILLTACSSAEVKADKKLVGTLTSTMDNQTLKSTIEIEYNSESGVATHGTFKTKYDGLEKTMTNNSILVDLLNRQSIIEELNGVKVSLNITEVSFDFEEIWNYNEINVKEAAEADEEQKRIIENDKYSVSKIKEVYEKQGYKFEEKKLK